MQKYATGAVRAIRTGYSEKRYDLKNKLQFQNAHATLANDGNSQKGLSDGGAPFKVYGKNKAANEFNSIVKQQKRVNNFNYIKDKFIMPPKSGTIPKQIMADHHFSFRDIDGTHKEQRDELRKAASQIKE